MSDFISVTNPKYFHKLNYQKMQFFVVVDLAAQRYPSQKF